MCSIFGTNKVVGKENLLFSVLGIAGEERGTDATGAGWLSDEKMKVMKDHIRASEFDWGEIPNEAKFFIGHTRKTTQGTEKNNYNNHPFLNKKENIMLAHNGIISNDKTLKKDWELDNTKIKTDSYVILQMIETAKFMLQKDEVDIDVILEVVELLQGSFALSILTTKRLFLLRHSNPLYYTYDGENLTYASTLDMFEDAMGFITDKSMVNYFNSPVTKLEKDTIYEFDILNNQFVDSATFAVPTKTWNKTYNYGSDSYYDKYTKNNYSRKYRTKKNYNKKTNTKKANTKKTNNKQTDAEQTEFEKTDFEKTEFERQVEQYNEKIYGLTPEEILKYDYITKSEYMHLPLSYKDLYQRCDYCGDYYKEGKGKYHYHEQTYLCNECENAFVLETDYNEDEEKINDNEYLLEEEAYSQTKSSQTQNSQTQGSQTQSSQTQKPKEGDDK